MFFKDISWGKVIFAITIATLFILNYHICNFVYGDCEHLSPETLIKWWKLRLSIYTGIIALTLILAKIGSDGLYRFILSIAIGFCISCIIDRLVYDENYYTKKDILIIIITTIAAYVDLWQKKNIRK